MKRDIAIPGWLQVLIMLAILAKCLDLASGWDAEQARTYPITHPSAAGR